MFHGVESLKLQYKGTQGYLEAVEKEQIWNDYIWLQTQKNMIEFYHFCSYFKIVK